MVYNQFVDFAINQSYRLGFSIMPQDDNQNEDTLTAKVQFAEKIMVDFPATFDGTGWIFAVGSSRLISVAHGSQ